jgi:AcrR family transcriptional regulator
MVTSAGNVVLLRQPRQARSRELVEKVCIATVSLAEESGVVSLNTNAIAERAGVDISSLYRFFPNKAVIIQYIVSEWLEQVRSVWDRYESDPALLKLTWEEYFCRLSSDWQNVETQDYYHALQDAWSIYPELGAMDAQHRENYVAFFIRQMKRFGARGTKEDWKDLAMYLYIVEDEVHSKSAKDIFSTLQAGRSLFLESMLHHLGKLMPTRK